MSDYQLPAKTPGFPRIRWHQRSDGRFSAEWEVEHSGGDRLLPLALRAEVGVDILLSSPSENRLLVQLVSDAKSIQPEVYSVFYQLIRPAFERGLIARIEGGDLEVHRYIIEGTSDEPF